LLLCVRREALFDHVEVRDRPSACCRSSGLELEAAWSGDRRGGREQPRQSRVGLVLPDGPGAVSETGRYTRGTGVVTPLEATPAQTRWIRAGSRRVPAPVGAGNSCPGLHRLGWEVTVNACGVAVAMPQG